LRLVVNPSIYKLLHIPGAVWSIDQQLVLDLKGSEVYGAVGYLENHPFIFGTPLSG